MTNISAPSAEAGVPEQWVRRYLGLLGAEREAPSAAALARLIRSQYRAVPFENVSSILRRRAHPAGPVPPPDPDVLLDNWERGGGGGVCFELAALFGRLLAALGYRAAPILAHISFPGSHQSVLVELDGGRYLAEVGMGAPFFEPIPLDRVVEVRRAGLGYRFRPDDAADVWVQDRLIGGTWTPFCRYELRPVTPEEREAAYQRHHTPGQSWVVDELRLIRCEDDAVLVLRGTEFSHFTPAGKRTEHVAHPADYVRLAREAFRLPALPMEEGVRAWAALAGPSPVVEAVG